MHCTGLLTRFKASLLTRFKASCQEQLPDFEQRVEDAAPWSRHLEEQAWPGAGGCGACSQVKMVLQFIKI